MATSSEILAALNSFRIHFEGQLHATNKTIQELHKSVDLWFDALQAGPLPTRSGSHGSLQRPPSPAEALAPASSPAFRSDGGSSVPQQRWLPNAPLQPPCSATPPPKPTPEPTAILTALLEKAGCKSSDSLSTFAPNDEASKEVDSPDLCKLSNAEVVPFLSFDVTSAAVSTSFSAAPPPSVVVSPPSPPSSTASPSPSAVAFPPSADSPLPLGSGVVLNRAGFAAPPPFLSPTTILAAPPTASGVNLTALFPIELFGKAPSPAPGPAPEVTSSPNSHIRPMPPTPPPTAPSASPSPSKVALFQPPAATISSTQFQLLGHRTKVGQIMENNFWPSPSDKEAQAMVIFLGTKDVLGHWWKHVLLGLFRRSVIFSLYALEEVYKDILESPP